MTFGLIAIVLFVVVLWVKETKKAAQDPDVIEASELFIPIWRYRKYQEAWNKIQDIYEKYGTNDYKAKRMVDEIISQLPNMNEWRRFGDRQLRKSMKSYNDLQEECLGTITNKREDEFKLLFEKIIKLENDYSNDDYVKTKITEIAHSVTKLEKWKNYCLSRRSDVKKGYNCFSTFTLIVDERFIVEGKILSYEFKHVWFFYEVEFEKPVTFDRSSPRRVHSLTDKQIRGIIKGEIQGICPRVDITRIINSNMNSDTSN